MIIGIVAAKKNSNRFPGKNFFPYRGIPLFWHAVSPLLKSDRIAKVIVCTDSEEIKRYSEDRGVSVIWRHGNASFDDTPLLQVLRYCYQHLDSRPDAVATIMANCPGHTEATVNEAVRLFEKSNSLELRTVTQGGIENGLMIFRSSIIENAVAISSHICVTVSEAREIHFKEELGELNR